eukprot:TRINITY_DN4128_c0_g1_i1.p1 TRINITY_DN4128_c0_g1~~TRINITY_DN4128_c0_g1_i1.p1  ORF type:complete len:499 (+),score=56.14 TRINITY_DN4128_c0_g1_i1:71-1567(+)
MVSGHVESVRRAELALILFGLLSTISVYSSRPSATIGSNGSVEYRIRIDSDKFSRARVEEAPRPPTGSEACERDTGGECKMGNCHESRGEAGCVDSKCICKEGLCASFGTCMKPDEMCDRDTTGECRIMPCGKNRGKTQCIEHQCVCEVGYCAVNGACEENKHLTKAEKKEEAKEEKAEENEVKKEEAGETTCFGRQVSWTISSQSKEGPWTITKLDELRTGDYVLSAMNPNGEIFADRVWKNLHLHEFSAPHEMLEIRHERGSLVVSPNHILYVNGTLRAAHAVRPGSVLHFSDVNFDVSGGQGTRGDPGVRMAATCGKETVVLQVNRVLDALINPLTHSGRLLVGARKQARLGRALESSEIGTYLREMVLSTTVVESPWNTLLAAAQLPRLGKLSSYALPDALHNSKLAEDTILISAMVVGSVPAPFAIVLTLVVDTVGTILFVTYHSTTLALTRCTSPLVIALLLSFLAVTSLTFTVAQKRRCAVATRDSQLVHG